MKTPRKITQSFSFLKRHNVETQFWHFSHRFDSPFSGQATIYAPALPFFQIPIFLQILTDFFYTKFAQATLSFANYWTDPTRFKEYLTKNIFLPILNNEVRTNRSESFKRGFLRIKRQVTIGGQQDGILVPWQTRYVIGSGAPLCKRLWSSQAMELLEVNVNKQDGSQKDWIKEEVNYSVIFERPCSMFTFKYFE